MANRFRRPALTALVAVLFAPVGLTPAGQGQPNAAASSFDPERAFDRMFGPSTPEEEQALAAIEIPIEDERAFGQPQVAAFLASLEQQGLRVLKRGKDVEYVRQLVDTLRPSMTNAARYPKLTLYVIDSPAVDARSFAGGTLLFSRGLLGFAENEAALIGIVGHELAHLDRGHLVVPLKRQRLLQKKLAEGTAGFGPQQFTTQGPLLLRLVSRPFRPEDEAAADRDGAAWAYRAGYDPRELARLFTALQKRTNEQKVSLGSFFRTHPWTEDRAEAILKQYDALQQSDPRDAPYRGRKNLAARTPKSQKEFAE